MALLALCACSDDESITPDVTVSVAANPNNPFSALVQVASDHDVSAVVEYGEGEAFDREAPAVDVQADDVVEVLILGLRAGQEHQLRVRSSSDDESWLTEPETYQTDPLFEDWPDCWVDFGVEEAAFDSEEVACSHMRLGERPASYYCVNRWGEPVWYLGHPEGIGILGFRALSDGTFAAVGLTESYLMRFGADGELLDQWSPLFFEGKTRFEHLLIDAHDVIEITHGPWAGALAIFTVQTDVVEGENIAGSGIIVFDPSDELVLWDWSSHGQLGDEQPIDPKLPYHRDDMAMASDLWMNANALVHGVGDDGRSFFLVSVPAHDWIFKIDTDTDAVVWRLGYHGDFQLVSDLEDPSSPELIPEEWFFFQHAPEITEQHGSTLGLLLFDNGPWRPAPDGELLDIEAYSRVVEYIIDEQTMRASIRFVHGGQRELVPESFYTESGGDADLLPDGQAVIFPVGSSQPMFIEEVSYPDGGARWRFSCEQPDGRNPLYRVNYFPSLYDTTWASGGTAR